MAQRNKRNRLKSHIILCLHQRELGLHSNCRDDLLKAFVEEKASLPSQNQPCEVSGQTRSTLLMEFSPDGKRIASTHGDHSIRVTDVRTGKCTHTLIGHPRTPWCIAFHPSNSDILGSGCLGGEVRIWDLQGGGSEVWHSDDALSIASMTFHPSDNVVLFAVSNKLHFWDWTRSEPFAVCETAHDFEKIRWVKFDCIGQRLLTAIANATDDGLSDGSPFPLFGERAMDASRYSGSGLMDVAPLIDNTNSFSQMHQLSVNDDSLMDLRTSWNENRNTAEQSRNLNNARRYAYDVTHQTYRSGLDGRSMFASDTYGSSRANDDNMLNGQRNTAVASEPGGASLLSRPVHRSPVPAPSSVSSISDWPSSSLSQERELEAGSALLSLASDGRQTPSRYVHSLSGDDAQRRFLTGDDPLSENLTLLEPGYVEVPPSTDPSDPFEDSSERTNASSPAPGRIDEMPRTVILNQLLQQEDVEGNRQNSSDSFSPSSDRPSQNSNLAAFRVESQTDLESTFTNDSRTRFPEMWFNPSVSWGVEPQSSLSSNSCPPAGSSYPPVSTETSVDSGLDLRLRSLASDENDADHSLEHSYAMPAEGNTATATEVSVLQENPIITHSSVSHTNNTDDWMSFGTSSERREGQSSTMTSLQSLSRSAVSSHFDISYASLSDERNQNPAGVRLDESHGSSSARCRLFPFSVQRTNSTSLSTTAAASATLASAAAAAASPGAHRTRRLEFLHRQSELRRLRRGHNIIGNQLHSLTRTTNHTDAASAGCTFCNNLNVPQIFSPGERRPTSSHDHVNDVQEHHRVAQSLRDEVNPYSGYFPLMETLPPAPDNRILETETTREHETLQQELNSSGIESTYGRLLTGTSSAASTREWLLNLSETSSSLDVPPRPTRVIPRIEIYSDDLDDRFHAGDDNVSQFQPSFNDDVHYLESNSYRPSHLSRSRFTSITERLRERQERINFHVEELRSRFGLGSLSSATVNRIGRGSANNNESVRSAGPLDDDLFSYPHGSSGFGSGADAVGESLGIEDRTQIVNRLRGFREEIQAIRLEMSRNREQERLYRSAYRYYMPMRHFRSNRDSLLSGDAHGQHIRMHGMHAALNRAISGALAANGESSVGSNVIDQTYRIQAWDFMKCQIPDLTDSESNVLVRRAKIHNDANVDISRDGCYLCTFTLPARNFSGDIMLSVFSLMPENFGECLFTKSFGPNAISVSISPCNRYLLVGLATKRFTWMFTPKQMIAQVYQLKNSRAEEDSMEHVCDITHPCDMDFRAPISMNSARWLLGPGEGLAYGTNRGDLNIYRPGFEQIEKPEVNDNLSDTNPAQRNLIQMLGLTVPRMMSTATQTSLNLRRSASTQTDQNSQSSSSSSASSSSSSSSSSSATATLERFQAPTVDTDDLNLF